MAYTELATADKPAFVIYLIDLSASMSQLCGGKPRIEVVKDALERTRRTMIARSRRDDAVRPRYAVTMLGYSLTVTDLLGGVRTIDQLEAMALPSLTLQGQTNTGAAFEAAYNVLQQFLPTIQECPAPLVCHLSDGGANTGPDPQPIADAIRQLSTADGNVLVENVYIGDQLLRQPITDVRTWPGVLNPSEIREDYVQKLWHMSSPLPEAYAGVMNEMAGYQFQSQARMLIPAETPEMIELAFAMSGSTPVNSAAG